MSAVPHIDSGDLTHRGYASPLIISLGGARHARLALVGARGFLGPAAAQAGARALHGPVVCCAHAPCEPLIRQRQRVSTLTRPAVSRWTSSPSVRPRLAAGHAPVGCDTARYPLLKRGETGGAGSAPCHAAGQPCQPCSNTYVYAVQNMHTQPASPFWKTSAAFAMSEQLCKRPSHVQPGLTEAIGENLQAPPSRLALRERGIGPQDILVRREVYSANDSDDVSRMH